MTFRLGGGRSILLSYRGLGCKCRSNSPQIQTGQRCARCWTLPSGLRLGHLPLADSRERRSLLPEQCSGAGALRRPPLTPAELPGQRMRSVVRTAPRFKPGSAAALLDAPSACASGPATRLPGERRPGSPSRARRRRLAPTATHPAELPGLGMQVSFELTTDSNRAALPRCWTLPPACASGPATRLPRAAFLARRAVLGAGALRRPPLTLLSYRGLGCKCRSNSPQIQSGQRCRAAGRPSGLRSGCHPLAPRRRPCHPLAGLGCSSFELTRFRARCARDPPACAGPRHPLPESSARRRPAPTATHPAELPGLGSGVVRTHHRFKPGSADVHYL